MLSSQFQYPYYHHYNYALDIICGINLCLADLTIAEIYVSCFADSQNTYTYNPGNLIINCKWLCSIEGWSKP